MKQKAEDRVYLREWRLAKGLTQPELAKRTGTVKSEISRLEKGSRRMTLEWMSAFARVMGITVDDLMTLPPMGFGAVSPAPKAVELDDEMEKITLGNVTLGIEGDEHAVVAVNGDDWAGVYAPGDLLIYDTGKKSTTAPGVYAFNVGGETIVRRVTPSAEATTLTCANPAYPPVPLSAAYKVLGRVVVRLHRV